jgi:hypothetical protein
MSVASESLSTAAQVSSNWPGRAASRARPSSSSALNGMTNPSGEAAPSKTTMARSAGSWARQPSSLPTCSSFSAKQMAAPESPRM